jgi:branched-chain amino acid transport system permease protein
VTNYLLGMVILASVNAILVLGLSILTTFTGFISIAAAATAGIGGYAYAVLATRHGFSPWIAALCAVALSGVVGLAVAQIVSRLRGDVHLLGTLALQLVVVETLRRWRDVTGGDAGIPAIPPLFAAMSPLALAVLATGTMVVIAIALHLWLSGPGGLRLRAVRDDQEVAAASGCNVRRSVTAAFGISAAIMGLAGVLVAMHHAFLQPVTFGMEWSISVLLMAMLGGANVAGCIVAAFFLTALPELVYLAIAMPGMQVGAIQNMVYGSVLLALMLLRPRGLFPETRLRRVMAATAAGR